MPIELKILALGAVLLFIYIFTATRFKTAQYGRKWNVSARDEPLPAANPITGRLMRAQANFEETFPIAIVALLGVVVAGRHRQLTALGGWIWLGARARLPAALCRRRPSRSDDRVGREHGGAGDGDLAAAVRLRRSQRQRPISLCRQVTRAHSDARLGGKRPLQVPRFGGPRCCRKSGFPSETPALRRIA